MKLVFNGYEIEIKAKKTVEKYNKYETLCFLNWLSMLSAKAEVGYNVDGYKVLARESGDFSSYLFGVCDDSGLYDVSRETEEVE